MRNLGLLTLMVTFMFFVSAFAEVYKGPSGWLDEEENQELWSRTLT